MPALFLLAQRGQILNPKSLPAAGRLSTKQYRMTEIQISKRSVLDLEIGISDLLRVSTLGIRI